MSASCFRKHRSRLVLLAEQVDQTCDRFEAAWKLAGVSNEPPHLEDYLAAVAKPGRSVLLRELVLLDVYYRRLRGEHAAGRL